MSAGPQTARDWPGGTPRPAMMMTDRHSRRIKVAVEAGDAFSRAGVAGLIGPIREVQLLPSTHLPTADVVVVVAPQLTGRVLRQLRALREVCPGPFVLIMEHPGGGDWLAAAEVGVTGAMWRSEVTQETLTNLIRTVISGRRRSRASC
jgi:DNA-binding NarL/FixJ family response regulator